MKPLLYVRNDPHDGVALVSETLEEAGLPVAAVDAADPGASWPALDEISGLVVGGGAMNADETEDYPFLLRERALLREAVDRDRPILGICLGAQLLARALDAPVVRAPLREVGFSALSLTAEGERDPLLSAFATGDPVFHFHEDTFGLPDGAVLLATGAAVPMQAYRVGERAWGIQFHPEVGWDEIEAWMAEVGDRLEPEWGKPAERIREEAARHLGDQQARGRVLFRGLADQVRAWEG